MKNSIPLDQPLLRHSSTSNAPQQPTTLATHWSAFAAGAPAVFIVAVCSVLPLLWMAIVILATPSVRNELRFDSFRAELLGRTVGYNGMAAVIATLMGLPAAFVLGRGRGLLARVLWIVLPAALLLPSLSYVYGWKQLLRMADPLLRSGLARGLGLRPVLLRPGGPVDVFRCIWSLAAWLWAVPAGLIGLALRRMDTSVQQQAVLDGALRRTTVRQLAGPIVASLAIVTVLSTQEFSVYEPTGISVVATEVRMVFDTGSLSSDTNMIAGAVAGGSGARAPDQAARAAAAVVTAAPLLAVTVLLAVIAAWGAGRTSAAEGLAVGDWPRVLDASWWAAAGTLLLVVLNVVVPIVALVKSLRVPIAPLKLLEEFGPQVQGALIVALAAAGVAVAAAFSAGGRWTRGLLALAGASFLVGGQLLAIALIRIYNRPGLIWAYDTAVVVVAAYVGRFGWIAIAAGRGTWSRAWQELRDMAAVDGAGTLRTAAAIVWPLAWPTLLAGGLLVGALSLTEVPATVLLMPQNPQVLTPMLMTWVHMDRSDPMIEASLLMMAAVLVPALAAVGLASLGLRAARQGGYLG